MLYNCPPSLSHLKTFGCFCYATVVSPKQKFRSRARQCIFIGYPPNKKAYNLFDIDADTFFTSRDVIFHESVFPLQGILPIINIDIDLPHINPTFLFFLIHYISRKVEKINVK